MTKEELSQCFAKRQELQQINKRIQALREDARSTRAICYSNEPRGRGEPIAAVQRYIEQLETLSALYEEKKADLMQDIIAVERAISALPPELRMLMRYRYIDGMRWEEIADIMHISIGTFHNWHNKALLLLKD